jgi:hypothetical protein
LGPASTLDQDKSIAWKQTSAEMPAMYLRGGAGEMSDLL